MTPLFTEEQYQLCKFQEKLPLQCKQCKNTFYQTKHQINKAYKVLSGLSLRTGITCNFCSRACKGKHKSENGNILKACRNCGDEIYVHLNDAKQNNFCSHSCSASYSNKNKEHGTRVSNLEIWLQSQLIAIYPYLQFEFNKKEYINSELDIYIPSLKLAFELNGIFHYEPIYGEEKLKSIQNNDSRKFQACLEKQIELCIIDTSSQKKFAESSSKKFLDIICEIIDFKKGDAR